MTTSSKPLTPPPTEEELATARALQRLARIIAEAKLAARQKEQAA